VLISREHFELNERYQKLLLKSMQQEKFLEKKDKEYKLLASKFAPLQRMVEGLNEKYNELHSLYQDAIRIIKEKDREIEELQLIKHTETAALSSDP
jgi:transposase